MSTLAPPYVPPCRRARTDDEPPAARRGEDTSNPLNPAVNYSHFLQQPRPMTHKTGELRDSVMPIQACDGPVNAFTGVRRATLIFSMNECLLAANLRNLEDDDGPRQILRPPVLRPGLGRLNRLQMYCSLGVYGAEQAHNLQSRLRLVNQAAGLFSTCSSSAGPILHRGHCMPAPEGHQPNQKPFSVIKPLGRQPGGPYFEDLSRVLIIDGDKNQAAPGEGENMVAMNIFQAEPDDCHLGTLVDILLSLESTDKIFTTNKDLRNYSGQIMERMIAVAGAG